MNLSKQIDIKINKERDELTQDITTQITETQEKIVFAVVRKSTVERGQSITFDTVIANIGKSIDASSGTFTTQRKGLYFSLSMQFLKVQVREHILNVLLC